jgi:hypothetical protein
VRAPNWGNAAWEFPWVDPEVSTPVTPTVYPLDDEVKEGLLGPDGKPLAEGTARKNPLGFAKGTPNPHPKPPPPPPPPPGTK